ncbi:MAG: undecaprenyl-diphosphate phosphatase [Thaumarchaeota archaeon]|nr:undecaprenyl-diphosphate phosphatase [Nitrososphaerota archaeon]
MTEGLPFILAAGLMLGVVQGVSEWLPISSKTQVIIASTILLGLTFSQAYALGLFLELGTFFAAIIYFRRELLTVFRAIFGKGGTEGRLLLKYLLVVTAITGVMGIAIYKAVESLSLGSAIGVPMLILGCVLILDGLFIRYSRSRAAPRKELKDMSLKELVFIGFAQGLAAFPGVSRSGVTVSAMLVLGTEAKESFRLSFLALIPASLGATLVTLIFSRSDFTGGVSALSPGVLAIAVVVSLVVGLMMIRLMLRIASDTRIVILVFALGILAIAFGILGIILGANHNLS